MVFPIYNIHIDKGRKTREANFPPMAEPCTNRELTIFSSEPTLGLDMGHFGGLRTAV